MFSTQRLATKPTQPVGPLRVSHASRLNHSGKQWVPGRNQAAQRRIIQGKLTVSQPGNHFEQEADRVADAIMRIPESRIEPRRWNGSSEAPPQVQRTCRECEDELHRFTASSSIPEVDCGLEAGIRSLGSGQPLPQPIKHFFEPRFGQDFSSVRMHTGATAATTARQINALAYTTGHDVVFGAGQYQPDTHQGQHLIAHELTHVVQQSGPQKSSAPQTIHRQEPVTDITIGAIAAKCILGAIAGALFDAAIQAIIYSIKEWTWRFWRASWDYCSLILSAVIGCIAAPIEASVLQPWLEARLGPALGGIEGTLLGKLLLYIARKLTIGIPKFIVKHLAMLGCISPEQAAELGVKRGAPDGPEPETPVPVRPAPANCKQLSGEITGDARVLMKVNTAEFLSADEGVKADKFADSVRGTGDKVNVHGLASVDGPSTFNDRLSCTRALRGVDLLHERGISDAQISDVFKHGEVSGPNEWERSVVFERVRTTPAPSGPTPTPTAPLRTAAVKLKSIRFSSDHGVLKDNRADWEDSGPRLPKPEWESTNVEGASAPITHSKAQAIQLRAVIDVSADAVSGTPFTLKGEGPESFLSFEGAGVLAGPGSQELSLTSKSTVPDRIDQFLNQTLIWSVSINSRNQLIGVSANHDVFVTYDTPTGGLTYKRAQEAVELTKGFGNDPHNIVIGEMNRFPFYNLKNPVSGNVWLLADDIPAFGGKGAECQAVVRFVQAVDKAMGMPGEARGIAIYASPSAPTVPLEAELVESGGARGAMSDFGNYALFDGGDNANNYEAALEFTNGGPAFHPDRERVTRYYPGGVPGGQGLKSKEDVLNVFKQMAETVSVNGKLRPGRTIWCYQKHAKQC